MGCPVSPIIVLPQSDRFMIGFIEFIQKDSGDLILNVSPANLEPGALDRSLSCIFTSNPLCKSPQVCCSEPEPLVVEVGQRQRTMKAWNLVLFCHGLKLLYHKLREAAKFARKHLKYFLGSSRTEQLEKIFKRSQLASASSHSNFCWLRWFSLNRVTNYLLRRGRTPLWHASSNGSTSVMQMLLDAGAGVDAKSNGRLDEKIEKRMGMGQRGRISWYFNYFMIFLDENPFDMML